MRRIKSAPSNLCQMTNKKKVTINSCANKILVDKNYGVPPGFIYNTDYDKIIDDFLYEKVTYDILWQLVPGIFTSPYAVTSLREYWAKGFEEVFIGDKDNLKQLCPVLYKKMALLLKDLKDATD